MTDTELRGAVALAPQHHHRLFIGGEWVVPAGHGRIDVVGAATEAVIGSVPNGIVADVDRAVAAARAAFESWAHTPVEERATFLERISAGLQTREDLIARTVASEVGTPLKVAMSIQAGLPVRNARLNAQLVRELVWEERVGNSLVLREPIGVVGCITPWNYPLHQVVAKVAPALAAGCTVVLKPSEVAPLTAFILAEVAEEVGLPAGVLNVVTGYGPVVGEAIAAHADVDMVSFTGSTAAGRRVAAVAAATVKRVALELGGKSANLILDDADLPRAVSAGVNNAFLNSGQTCTAWTRMLVPRHRQAEAEQLAAAAADRLPVGDPLEEATRLGPLASARQLDRVRRYIRTGVEEGARLVCGGAEPPEGVDRGYFVRPTVFADVSPGMTIAQEEIFGPVLAIIPYDGEEDAVRIANATIYGLAAAVWSADAERAERVARRVRAGQVDINGGRFNPLAPFGGYRQSGLGREMGVRGIEEFLEVKSLQT